MAQSEHGGQGQLGLDLGDSATPRCYAPDPADVRAELLEILDLARAANTVAPWDARTFRHHRAVFPQMARWLPADERDQLCFEFARHADRIETLLVA